MRFTRHALNGSVQEARIWFMDQESHRGGLKIRPDQCDLGWQGRQLLQPSCPSLTSMESGCHLQLLLLEQHHLWNTLACHPDYPDPIDFGHEQRNVLTTHRLGVT